MVPNAPAGAPVHLYAWCGGDRGQALGADEGRGVLASDGVVRLVCGGE